MEHFFLPGVQNFFPIVSITCCHVKEIAAGVHKTNKVASPLVAFHVLVTITLTEVLDSTATVQLMGYVLPWFHYNTFGYRLKGRHFENT